MVATGRTAAPKTAYAFPGQGIQARAWASTPAPAPRPPREIWDRADEHTRKALGFSILAVVRDNPTVPQGPRCRRTGTRTACCT